MTLAERAARAAKSVEDDRMRQAINHLEEVVGVRPPCQSVRPLTGPWFTCSVDEYDFVFDDTFIQAAPNGSHVRLPRYSGAWGVEAGRGWSHVGRLADLAKVEAD